MKHWHYEVLVRWWNNRTTWCHGISKIESALCELFTCRFFVRVFAFRSGIHESWTGDIIWCQTTQHANYRTTPFQLPVTSASSEARFNMHYLDGIILLIYHFSWYFKLICEHCKFEQMNKTFCDRTHVNRILFIFAVVNFDWVFCLSCATWLRAKWSWWLDFIGNSVIQIHNLKLLNTKL